MNTKILFIAMQLVFVFPVMGQDSPPKQTPCYEDPLALIKNANLRKIELGIMMIGEIKRNAYLYAEPDMTLTKAIARLGGVTPETINYVKIFRKKEIINANINLIKTGKEKDVALEKGDLVYFPVKCSNQKFMEKLKLDFQRLPNYRDYPVKRRTKNNSSQKMV